MAALSGCTPPSACSRRCSSSARGPGQVALRQMGARAWQVGWTSRAAPIARAARCMQLWQGPGHSHGDCWHEGCALCQARGTHAQCRPLQRRCRAQQLHMPEPVRTLSGACAVAAPRKGQRLPAHACGHASSPTMGVPGTGAAGPSLVWAAARQRGSVGLVLAGLRRLSPRQQPRACLTVSSAMCTSNWST